MAIRKIKFFVNYEKEEKWLNKMAAKGLNLISYKFGRYFFEEGEPGEYNYRFELLDELPSHDESKAYISFMEENGVEFVDASFRWVYFRKKVADEPFEIYSDNKSRIKRYKRIVSLLGTMGFANLVIAIVNTNMSNLNVYMSILNWLVVAILVPIVLSYLRIINSLNRDAELFDK